MDETAVIYDLQRRIALHNDMKAYKELYKLLYGGLHRFSYAFVKSNEVAEEIVSDVFVKLWQITNKLMEIENLKVYLYIIAKNFSLNYLAKNSKKTIVSIDAIDIEAIVEIKSIEEYYISTDIVLKIRQVIQQLPPQCKIIFQLVKEEGMKYKEVAEVLNLSLRTVRNQVAIATGKIAEALPPYLLTAVYGRNKLKAV